MTRIPPAPPHARHIDLKTKSPFDCGRLPVPLQLLHFVFFDPGLAPDPSHVLQLTKAEQVTSFSHPSIASMKSIVSGT